MILADTSVWVEFLQGKLAIAQEDFLRMATCGPVIQEVMQGLRPGAKSHAFLDSLLALPRLADPLPLARFQSAANLYREGRGRGYTIRSGTDCLIAAVAIENRVPVWHRDRDYDAIAGFTPLQIWTPR
jgi:predicted nucleic acid-binding protein